MSELPVITVYIECLGRRFVGEELLRTRIDDWGAAVATQRASGDQPCVLVNAAATSFAIGSTTVVAILTTEDRTRSCDSFLR